MGAPGTARSLRGRYPQQLTERRREPDRGDRHLDLDRAGVRVDDPHSADVERHSVSGNGGLQDHVRGDAAQRPPSTLRPSYHMLTRSGYYMSPPRAARRADAPKVSSDTSIRRTTSPWIPRRPSAVKSNGRNARRCAALDTQDRRRRGRTRSQWPPHRQTAAGDSAPSTSNLDTRQRPRVGEPGGPADARGIRAD